MICKPAILVKRNFKTLNPFEIRVRGIEQAGPIVWLTMQENAELSYIHKKLDEMLFEKYNVMQHVFDKDFKFHTSVFMINNQEAIAKAFDRIKDTYIPEILMAKKFIIGSSEEGIAGTYRVIEEMQI